MFASKDLEINELFLFFFFFLFRVCQTRATGLCSVMEGTLDLRKVLGFMGFRVTDWFSSSWVTDDSGVTVVLLGWATVLEKRTDRMKFWTRGCCQGDRTGNIIWEQQPTEQTRLSWGERKPRVEGYWAAAAFCLPWVPRLAVPGASDFYQTSGPKLGHIWLGNQFKLVCGRFDIQ